MRESLTTCNNIIYLELCHGVVMTDKPDRNGADMQIEDLLVGK